MRTTIHFAGSAASPDQFPQDGLPEVAFLGRSNVGKSSLLNALAGVRNLARVSSTPGRTRLVNFFRVANDFYLADLPGYGYAKVAESERRGWDRLAASYLLGRDAIALCVFLLDARHEPSDGDLALQAFLDHHGLAYVVAATKTDKLGRGALLGRMRGLEAGIGRRARAVIACSAVTGAGKGELWREVREAAARRRQGAA
ncbi:MAG TPA: ribosome biogenesis GTP-binding protein YihA/YsxC [Vicinamibacteria bacterium]|nr:ribosome biogenesis GTP-binding protein YihA/YsxC [Vicinamibacteria bacterium]